MNILSKIGLAALIATCVAGPMAAQETDEPAPEAAMAVYDRWLADPLLVFDASEVTLDDLHWLVRPLVVFADTPNDPRFIQQMERILADADQLAVRDVLVIVDTNSAEMSSLREKLRPRGFMMALLAKDGTVALRKPAPWSVRELTRSIDKMPLRQQEIADRR